MPVNRRTRDQIILEALDLADLPELDQHDRPTAGTVDTGAFAINWLQRAVDTVAQEFPWASEITTATGTISALNQNLISTLSDFILDVRDGMHLQVAGDTKRLRRINFADIMSWQMKNDKAGDPTTGVPALYAFTSTTLRLDITPQEAYTYRLWYYALPGALSAAATPPFPSDHACVEFVFWRAQEWARKMPPGTSMKYLREVEIAAMRAAGLGQEPESTHIPLDPLQFRGARRRPWDWMGDVNAYD